MLHFWVVCLKFVQKYYLKIQFKIPMHTHRHGITFSITTLDISPVWKMELYYWSMYYCPILTFLQKFLGFRLLTVNVLMLALSRSIFPNLLKFMEHLTTPRSSGWEPLIFVVKPKVLFIYVDITYIMYMRHFCLVEDMKVFSPENIL